VRVFTAEQHRWIGTNTVRPDLRHDRATRGEERGERRFAAAARECAAALAGNPTSAFIQAMTRCSSTVPTGDISNTAID
jgi:hypothetical protein